MQIYIYAIVYVYEWFRNTESIFIYTYMTNFYWLADYCANMFDFVTTAFKMPVSKKLKCSFDFDL